MLENTVDKNQTLEDLLQENKLYEMALNELQKDNAILSKQNEALKLIVAEYDKNKIVLPLQRIGIGSAAVEILEENKIFTVDALLEHSITELIKDVGLKQSAIKRINQRLHLYLFPTLKP